MSVWIMFRPIHQRPNGSCKCHYAFTKCGEFNCHPEPLPPIMRLCYPLIVLPVVTSVAGRDTL